MSHLDILTVDEVLAKFERPIWATWLCIRTSYALQDYTPYYWVGDGQYKRVTSKLQRFHLGHYGEPEFTPMVALTPIKFKRSFFKELTHATRLEF